MTRRTGNQNHHHNNNRTGSVGAGPGGSNSRPQHAKQEEGEVNTLVVRKKPVGLVNLGNTCFMNSALQCLSRTPNLISRLEMLANDPILNFSGSALSYNDENLKNELQVKLVIPHDTVIRKLLHLLKQMTEGTMNGPVNPRSVQLAVSKNFGIGLQHDSHELLRTVLDKMKKEQIKAFRVALMEVFKVPINEAAKVNQTDPQKALEMKEWDRKFYHTTCVDEIFGGELLTTRTCLECNTIKNSSEEFLDISLPILVVKPNSQQNNKTVYNNRFSMWNDGATKNRTLSECFQSFIEAEVLSGNNQVDCEKCHEMKLNQVRRGVPIEQVFPQPEPSTITTRTSTSSTPVVNKNLANKSAKGSTQLQQQQQLQPQQKPQQSRKKKKKKTRKDKIAEDLLVQENLAKEKEESSLSEAMGAEATGENEKIIGAVGEVDEESATSETDMPELEKISDEGYAEDYKDSDDSTGATSGNEHESVNQGRSPYLDLQDQEQAHAESQVDQEETSDQDETPASETEITLTPIVVIPKSTKSSCRRQTMISKPPHNLTIHLKRFTMSSKGFTCKIGDHVKFSEYIDIRDFVTTSFPNDDQSSQVSSSSWSFEELASMANTNKEGTEETGADPAYPEAVEGSGDNHQTSVQPLSESVIIALPPAQITLPANPPISTTSCAANISAEDGAISSTSLTAVNASQQPNDRSNPANFATATASPPGNGSDFEFLGSPMSAVTGDNNFSFHSADTQDFLPDTQSSPDATAPIRVRVDNFTKISETQDKEPVKLNESSSDDTETENGFTLIKKPFVEPELESKGDIIAAMAAATASGSTSVSDNNDAFKNFAGDTFLIERNLSSNLDQVDIMEENEDDIVCDSHSNCNANDNDIDDEPPPYPGSPILDENDENDFTDNERPLRDVILPEDTGCSVWGYKTKQDIVEWTFKSEEAKEFGPEPVDMFAVADHSHEELQMENLEDDLSIQVSDIENSCGDIGTSSSLYGSTKINSASISVIPLPPPLPSASSLSSYSVPVTESVRSHIALDLNLEGNDEDMSPPNIIPLGFSSIDEMNRTNYDTGSRSRQQDKDLSWGGSDIGAKGDVGTDVMENLKTTESFGADLMDPNGIVYRLNGIVEHSGSLHWGHYVAYVRVNSDWFYVSDSHVMSSDISTVLSQDPYILFYERVTPTNSNNPVHNQPDQTTVIP